MTTPMEAYNQLILQEMHSDFGMGVHKISEKTNHRWKDGFLAGYAAGQREALLDASNWFGDHGYRDAWSILRSRAKELE